MDGTSAAETAKAPKPFLRRGEGVEKRVFAARYRKPSTPGVSGVGRGSSGGSDGDVGAFGAEPSSGNVAGSGRRADQAAPLPEAKAWPGCAQDLTGDNLSLGVQPQGNRSSGGPISSRLVRTSVRTAWDTQQAEEDLELEEFRALETQIKADVVGGSSSRQRQERQDQVPQASAASTAGPGGPSSRSYAALHQHQSRPPHLPPAPRPSSRSSDHSAAGSGPTPPLRGGMGWSPPQQPVSEQKQQHRDFGLADAGDADDGFGDSVGDGFDDEEGMGGEEGGGASTWGQEQSSFLGMPPTQAGSNARGFGTSGSHAADVGQGGWAPGGGGFGAPVAGPAAARARQPAFDDGDAWNDTSSFFSGGGAGGRKEATYGAAGGAAHKPHGKGSGRQQQQPLDDPWATSAGGNGSHGADDGAAGLDDSHGWGTDQQQPQEQQHGARGYGRDEEERGPDQPFVRALFNKQRPQQQGPVRPTSKAAAGPGGSKGRPAEPAGPSAAEVEKLQALDEQLNSVSAERSALVRMRTELEKAANRLEQERNTWERTRAEEQARWEAQREAEEGKLRRERRVLEKQSKAILKLPNKKERSAMEAAEAALEAERREGRGREARHKLTVERLRRQLLEVQERNHELREEVRWHEAQQLERGWPGPGGASEGGAKAKQGQGPQAAKPVAKACRAASSQTEPLPFLPPLEDAVAAPPPSHGDDYPGPAATSFRRPGTSAAVATAAGPAAAARPRSSGSNLGARGSSIAANSRLRSMQVGRSASAAAGPASPQQQQSSWRVQREGPRCNQPGGVATSAFGIGGQWRESDAEGMEEEGEEYGFEEASGSVRGQQEKQTLLRHSRASGSWWQGEQDGCGNHREDGLGEEQGEEVDEWHEREQEEHQRREQEERHGRMRAVPGRQRGAANSSGGAAGSPVRSAHSYVQNDDAEVFTGDEDAGDDGLDSESLAALAWQQHQEFMSRMGLPPEGIATQPMYADDRRAAGGQAGGQAPGQQRQPQLQPQRQLVEQGQGHRSRARCVDTGEPGTSGRQQPAWPGGVATQGQQHQHQQQHLNQRRSAGGQGGRQAAAAGTQHHSPGDDGTGGGLGQGAGSAFPGSGRGGGASGTQQQPRGPATTAAVAAAATSAAGPSWGPSQARGSSNPARSAGPPQQQQPRGEHAGDPAMDLDGVSQTLAALRMDRRVEAAAAAAATGSGPVSGRGFSGGAGAPVGLAGSNQAPGGGAFGLMARHTQVADRLGRQAAQAEGGQAGPGHWQNAEAPPPLPTGWGSSRDGGAVHTSAERPHFPAQARAPGSGGPAMAGSAAGAAAVAHAVASQQLRNDGSGANGAASGAPCGSSGGRTSSGGGAGGGGGSAGDNVLLREVRHGDGKVERMYGSGTRLVLFANGTRKVALADGTSRVYFANGDIKWTVPASAAAPAGGSAASTTAKAPGVGVVHYFYAEVGTWHSTYSGEGGVEVFYFPSGQTEAHHPGRGKEIAFPDGVLRVVTADGEEVNVTWQQLSWAIREPQPQVDGLGDDDL